MLFCCDVGGSDLKIKASSLPPLGLYKKSIFRSENCSVERTNLQLVISKMSMCYTLYEEETN